MGHFHSLSMAVEPPCVAGVPRTGGHPSPVGYQRWGELWWETAKGNEPGGCNATQRCHLAVLARQNKVLSARGGNDDAAVAVKGPSSGWVDLWDGQRYIFPSAAGVLGYTACRDCPVLCRSPVLISRFFFLPSTSSQGTQPGWRQGRAQGMPTRPAHPPAHPPTSTVLHGPQQENPRWLPSFK